MTDRNNNGRSGTKSYRCSDGKSDFQLPIIFQNKHFIAVDKPSGCLSVPSRMGTADERPVLGLLLEAQLGQRLWPVHRLDFEVSGLILYALNAPAHRAANAWFEHHKVQKTYAALSPVPTSPEEFCKETLWKSILFKGKKRTFEAPHGKPAETLATLVKILSDEAQQTALWHLKPLTGRSHQLRFELAKRSCPIIGDKLYGSDRVFTSSDAIALRSFKLDFTQCAEASKFDLPHLLETSGFDTAPL